MSFTGFPRETFKFLNGLTRNNKKEWFDAHRADYEAFYIEPAKAFVADLGAALRKFSPEVQAEPRVNGSIFRINRDIRFSKDKTPYKNHLDLWFWQGDRKTGPGYFFRLMSNRLMIGVGSHGFSKEALGRYRDRVADPAEAKALRKLITKVEKAGHDVGGQTLKKLPRGYQGEGDVADLLRHTALYSHVETAVPPESQSKGFVSYCAKTLKPGAPLLAWLADGVA